MPKIKTKLSDKTIGEEEFDEGVKPNPCIQKSRSNKVCPKK
jgi:hypothetical protein